MVPLAVGTHVQSVIVVCPRGGGATETMEYGHDSKPAEKSCGGPRENPSKLKGTIMDRGAMAAIGSALSVHVCKELIDNTLF